MTANFIVPATGTVKENRDSRLVAAIDAVNKGQFDLVSFDCFDTLLYRKVPKPTDLFEILGQRLLDKGMMAPHIPARAFAAQRILAEQEARIAQVKRINSGEIRLRQIWNDMPAGLFPDHDLDDIIQEELDCEHSLLRYDQNMLNLALLAKNKGIKTTIVSDTYFEAGHMQRFLDRKSGSFQPDHLLLSSDYGASKAGGLLAMLPRLTDTSPERILHIGDAPHADIEPAQKHGIMSCFFPKETTYSQECRFREHEFGDLSRPTDWFDSTYGDYGLTSLRVKTAFDLEAGRFEDGKSDLVDFSANALAAAFSWFAVWVKERAAAHGLDKLHLLMREGAYLGELLDGDQTLPPIEHSTLWASRYALTRAGIYNGSPKEIMGFIDRPILMTIEQMAVELGLQPEDVGFHQQKYGDYLKGEDNARSFLQGLSDNKTIRKKIIETSAKWRRNYLEYLHNQIDLKNTQVLGLVDLGYSGTIQRSLINILRSEGYAHIQTIGLYMLTTSRASSILAENHQIEGFLANLGEREQLMRSIYRSPEVLEQVCMPNVGSLISMDDKGHPIQDDHLIDPQQYADVTFMRRAIQSFQHNHALQNQADRLEGSTLAQAEDPILRRQLGRILHQMLMFPTPTDMRVIGDWNHDENYASTRTRKLVDFDSFDGRFDHHSVQSIAETMSHACFWPTGVAASKDHRLAELVSRVSLRESTAGAADGLIGEGKAKIHFDTGPGYGNCPSLEVEYKCNPYGRAWFRGSITAGGTVPVALGIQFGKTGEIIRVDHLSLTGNRLNGEKFDIDIIAASPEGLPWLNASILGSCLARIDDQPALISLTNLNDKLYGLEELHVEVRFSIMPPLPERDAS